MMQVELRSKGMLTVVLLQLAGERGSEVSFEFGLNFCDQGQSRERFMPS
jgi:hypothetical protein